MNEQLPIPLPATFATSLPERAQRIRTLVTVARGCIIEIGRELIAASDDVPHGEWGDWLRVEFDWTIKTAQKYIDVAAAFRSEHGSLGFDGLTIDATALYALSAPDVPQEARDEAIARAEAGEQISKAEAEQIVADAQTRIEAQFREQLQAMRDKTQAEALKEIEAAGKSFMQTKAALEAEIERLTTAEAAPGVPEAVDLLCKITGRERLTPKQFKLVAQVLGVAVTDGRKVYQPVSDEEVREVEISLEIAGPAVRALEYFSGAPAPDEFWKACPQPLRAAAGRNAEAAIAWLKKLQTTIRRGGDGG
jgi:hypothetical protein